MFDSILRTMARDHGLVVRTMGVSKSGSAYATIVRPWIPNDAGFRVRLSDHLPSSGRVQSWVDFRSSHAGLTHLRDYLRVKAKRGHGRYVGRGCVLSREVELRAVSFADALHAAQSTKLPTGAWEG